MYKTCIVIVVDDRMKTFYDLLNIPPTASPLELKQAYFESLRLNHPDKGATDLDKFSQIKIAYEILRYANFNHGNCN